MLKNLTPDKKDMKLKISDLQEKINRLETLINTSMVFSSILDLGELLNIVMTKAEEVMEAEASSVFLIDKSKKELYFITARGEKGKEAKEIRVPMGKGIVGWVAEHGRPLLVPDVKKDSIGVSEVLNKKGNRHFNENDLELFEALGHQIAIAVENASLYTELDELFLSSIRAIVEAVDAKDPYTKGHSARVVEYSLLIGEALADISKDELKQLEVSAILHDVGKIGVPDKILGKTGKLTPVEYAYMQRHSEFGSAIIEPIAKLRELIPNIMHHHERFDGKGYPDGLKAERIPLFARIICIADSFDAMTTDRPYRKKRNTQKALDELEKQSGTQFDPKLTKIFIMVCKRRK